MDWRNIPSLAALRAFEAAARTGSLSAAARELNVTHVAISQHVRTLEAHFSLSLLIRDGQRMVVTKEAASMADDLTQGFGLIAKATTDLLDRNRQRPLRIATTPSFAAGWLMPRMTDFWRKHPDIDVELLSSHDLVDFRRDSVDAALRYGAGNWPGLSSEPLMTAEYVAVAQPGLYPINSDLSQIKDATWLIHSPTNEDRTWLRSRGIDLETATLRQQGSSALLIEAVKAGLGIGALTRTSAAEEIRAGRVEVIAEDRPEDGMAYHIVTLPEVHNPKRDLFTKWLRRAVAD